MLVKGLLFDPNSTSGLLRRRFLNHYVAMIMVIPMTFSSSERFKGNHISGESVVKL